MGKPLNLLVNATHLYHRRLLFLREEPDFVQRIFFVSRGHVYTGELSVRSSPVHQP
jgi:hypothetical protein